MTVARRTPTHLMRGRFSGRRMLSFCTVQWLEIVTWCSLAHLVEDLRASATSNRVGVWPSRRSHSVLSDCNQRNLCHGPEPGMRLPDLEAMYDTCLLFLDSIPTSTCLSTAIPSFQYLKGGRYSGFPLYDFLDIRYVILLHGLNMALPTPDQACDYPGDGQALWYWRALDEILIGINLINVLSSSLTGTSFVGEVYDGFYRYRGSKKVAPLIFDQTNG
ncbi:hypothetical protein VNO77_04357 [Canavalia gladiata]|uniref:Uncharacterized protein n=1 Tax=Canavalia gladiata TaxID=3824 RepID=A0AAN9MX10_CANGL